MRLFESLRSSEVSSYHKGVDGGGLEVSSDHWGNSNIPSN
jgi:hypothetical protein